MYTVLLCDDVLVGKYTNSYFTTYCLDTAKKFVTQSEREFFIFAHDVNGTIFFPFNGINITLTNNFKELKQ